MPPSAGAVGGEITHFNLHSCFADVGLCTPFVENTPGLSTHNPVLTGTLDADGDATFEQDLILDEGLFTVIAHARWIDSSGLQRDMARARSVNVEASTDECATVRRVSACVSAGVTADTVFADWMTLNTACSLEKVPR